MAGARAMLTPHKLVLVLRHVGRETAYPPGAMRRALVFLTLLAVLCAPTEALANGDPASDVLISDTVFLPYDAPSPQVADELRSVIDTARTAGQPVRVAVIQSRQDLGAVSNMFGFPREYARLLAQELGNPIEAGAKGKRDPLLIVMPAGYGMIGFSGRAERELRNIEIGDGATSDDLARAAGYGVQVLARANGHPIKDVFERPAKPGGGSGALVPLLVALSLAGLAAFLIIVRVRSAKGEPGASA